MKVLLFLLWLDRSSLVELFIFFLLLCSSMRTEKEILDEARVFRSSIYTHIYIYLYICISHRFLLANVKNIVVLISTNDGDKRTRKSAKKKRRRKKREKDERIEKRLLPFFFIIHTYVRMSTAHHSLFFLSRFFLCLTSVLVCLRFLSLYCSTICYICRSKKRKRTTD